MLDGPKGVIIGFGVVGQTTAKSLDIPAYVDVDDKSISQESLKSIGTYILCLPTPTVDGKQDISAIHEWLRWIKKNYKPSQIHLEGYQETKSTKPLVVIRSTVLPGTTKKLQEKYPGMDIVHVPEFLTMSSAIKDAEFPELLVIGADSLVLRDITKQLFQPVQEKKLIYCSPTTAELIKYAMNSFFALKVIYANQLWDVANTVGADYGAVAKALESHKWGSKNGWDVWHGGYRGYGGACLPKDVKAFYRKFKLPLLETIEQINDKLVKESK